MIQPSSLEKLLCQRSLSWHKWFQFIRSEWPDLNIPKGGAVARTLRKFINLSTTEDSSVVLDSLRDRFAIKLVSKGSSGLTQPGQGWVRVIELPHSAQGCDIRIAIGNATTARRNSILAHEIGHLFLASLQEARLPGAFDHRQRDRKAEQFCWEFALEMLCPVDVRREWSWDLLQQLLSKDTPSLITRDDSVLKQVITYWHLRGLASRQNISIRMTAMALDRHEILEASSCIVAIFRYAENRYSKTDPELRLIFQSRPSAYYLIPNQRASHQGFSAAERIYRTEPANMPVVIDERIKLRVYRRELKPAWKAVDYKVPCIYTPIDVKGEGRYLLASFKI